MAGDLHSLDPEFRDSAISFVDEVARYGLLPKITSARRTRTEQTRLYRKYLAGLSPLPAAPPGNSAHELGLAFDMVVSPEAAILEVGSAWQSIGGVYGGTTDPVHFEAPWAQGQLAQGPVEEKPEHAYQVAERVVSRLPVGLRQFVEFTGFPEYVFLRAIAAVPGLETILSFFGPTAIPISILQLLESFF